MIICVCVCALIYCLSVEGRIITASTETSTESHPWSWIFGTKRLWSTDDRTFMEIYGKLINTDGNCDSICIDLSCLLWKLSGNYGKLRIDHQTKSSNNYHFSRHILIDLWATAIPPCFLPFVLSTQERLVRYINMPTDLPKRFSVTSCDVFFNQRRRLEAVEWFYRGKVPGIIMYQIMLDFDYLWRNCILWKHG